MTTNVEEDGDEIFTKISDGCTRCRLPGQIVELEKKLTWVGLFWVCPQCNGFYGRVEKIV